MGFNPAFYLNPEFVKSVRTHLPRRRVVFVLGFTVALVAVLGGLIWNSDINVGGTHPPPLAQRLRIFGQDSYEVSMIIRPLS